MQILIGIAAILGVCFILWCYYSAQEVDENYKPLEPQKTPKDLWNDIKDKWENLNDHLALGLLILGFSILVWLVNTIIFKIQ
jgi:Na+/melibiose symporter-like transporter